MCSFINSLFQAVVALARCVLVHQVFINFVCTVHIHVELPQAQFGIPSMFMTLKSNIVFCLSSISLVNEMERLGVVPIFSGHDTDVWCLSLTPPTGRFRRSPS